jgi:glycerol-3-phosphate dehydrogenase
VHGVADGGDAHLLRTSRGELRACWLVNAAGLHADELDRMLGFDELTVTPRRGQLLVFDKLARPLVRHVLLPVPGLLGKGVLVAPTVFGNVLLGPTAEDLDDKTASGSTRDGVDGLLGHGRRILPALLDEEVTAVYAGLRAATVHADYAVRVEPDRRYLCLGGIRSTGLTASMAIAEHAVELMADAGLRLGAESPLAPVRMPPLGERTQTRPHADAARIAADPAYGTVVCHCERVSRGELRDALAGPVPATTLDGLRRRTRALNGRCQGFYCGAVVRATLAEART